ncbi:MAG: Zn-ribbon domain-containing OB-fold protein [Candidatus Bathyarchaeia archaeon]
MSILGVPFHWRRRKERYRLIGSRCEICGKTFFPKREICPNCRRRGRIVDVELPGRGRVYSYTVIRVPSEGFEYYTPYVIAIIELENGTRIMSQSVDCNSEDVYIGMLVEVCFRRIFSQGDKGIISYGFKFRPLDETWVKYYEEEAKARVSEAKV